MARPPLVPWFATASARAGLPTNRAGWLGRVLPLIARGAPNAEIANELRIPRTTWGPWRRWLATEQAEGRLPEWDALSVDPMPEPRMGARPGGPPRGAALARHEAKVRREAVR